MTTCPSAQRRANTNLCNATLIIAGVWTGMVNGSVMTWLQRERTPCIAHSNAVLVSKRSVLQSWSKLFVETHFWFSSICALTFTQPPLPQSNVDMTGQPLAPSIRYVHTTLNWGEEGESKQIEKDSDLGACWKRGLNCFVQDCSLKI